MKRKSLAEKMRERTANIQSTAEISLASSLEDIDPRFPRTGVGVTAAWVTALARIRVLEEALHKAHVEIENEEKCQEMRGMKGLLMQAWNRIDWLEEKFREHGLSVPSSGT
ncbi:hypothetical protein [Burkholderia multivorans]|uniref:hypothetical protein n=1 Tax=Burkholderia multivorans TaxID=87883 RepID=UPI0012D99FE8|nr:hypothetical protein [Burkholderia multivorans]